MASSEGDSATNQASNFFDLVAYLQREEVRDARRQVHKLGNFDEWRDDKKSIEAAQQVGSSYDIAAVAIKNSLINARVFAEPWRTSICSTYKVIKDYIKDRQEKTDDCMYLAHYVGLARWLKGEAPQKNDPYGVSFPAKNR